MGALASNLRCESCACLDGLLSCSQQANANWDGITPATSACDVPLGQGIKFEILGKEYIAIVIAAQSDKHLKHLIKYKSGASGTEWVHLDASSRQLSDEHGHSGVAYGEQIGGLWDRDVEVGNINDLNTTGGHTWSSSFALFDYLEASWPLLGLPSAVHVLELGSGTGWLGMSLARNIRDFSAASIVVLTDQSGRALDWLKENIAGNVARGIPLQAVYACALDWCELADVATRDMAQKAIANSPVAMHDFNLLLGADLVYDAQGARLLPSVIWCFLQRNPKLLVLIAHKMGRFQKVDVAFLQSLRSKGLSYHAVAAQTRAGVANHNHELDPLACGVDAYLASSPKHRVVIFQIILARCNQRFLPWNNILS